jgi:hypothetical protein
MLRNLQRGGIYSVINIGGLAMPNLKSKQAIPIPIS